MITVCACESQPILIEGLRATLELQRDFRFLGAVTDPREAIGLVTAHAPTVCLIDNTFGAAGLRLATEMVQLLPESKPVLWTDSMVGVESFRALQAGVRGILNKALSAHAILECLWAVGHGNIWIESSISRRFVGFISRPSNRFLTEREQEILQLIMRSKTNREIAAALSISVSTVKLHLLHMFDKAGVKTRLQLALCGLQWQGVLFAENEGDPLAGLRAGSNGILEADSAALASYASQGSDAATSWQAGANDGQRAPLASGKRQLFEHWPPLPSGAQAARASVRACNGPNVV